MRNISYEIYSTIWQFSCCTRLTTICTGIHYASLPELALEAQIMFPGLYGYTFSIMSVQFVKEQKVNNHEKPVGNSQLTLTENPYLWPRFEKLLSFFDVSEYVAAIRFMRLYRRKMVYSLLWNYAFVLYEECEDLTAIFFTEYIS